MKFEMSEIEELIENDFLNLDEFIFKFKWTIHLAYSEDLNLWR